MLSSSSPTVWEDGWQRTEARCNLPTLSLSLTQAPCLLLPPYGISNQTGRTTFSKTPFLVSSHTHTHTDTHVGAFHSTHRGDLSPRTLMCGTPAITETHLSSSVSRTALWLTQGHQVAYSWGLARILSLLQLPSLGHGLLLDPGHGKTMLQNIWAPWSYSEEAVSLST